ncbi:MAG: translocation/assembly module TamB domain-containing protein [Myxococcus sp.]|nr:translocation/assembly module TamB domain-containing protein [Myxococcus sp.]
MKRRRLGRRLLGVALLLVGLVLLLLIGGLVWFKSAAGQGFIRAQVVSAVKGAIAGRLEFGGVDFEGGHLVLTGLELYTPEGELVAKVARVELDVDLVAALREDYRVSRVRIVEPRLTLVQDERGLNLLRAIASTSPPAPASPASKLKLTVDGVELVDGDASFTDGARTVRLEQLAATGEARLTTSPLTVRSSLALHATGLDPVKGPVTLTVSTTSPRPDTVRADVDLRFADEVVKGAFDWPALSAELEQVRVTPALVEALTGSSALRRPVELSGALSLTGADVKLTGGAARVSVKTAWDLDAQTVSSFALEADEVDLSQWLDGAAPSRLRLSLRGSAPNLALERLTGALAGELTWKTPEGQTLVEGAVDLRAAEGQASVTTLRAKVPGASVSLSGKASLTALALAGALEATDLAKLPAMVKAFTGVTVPRLAGRGVLAVQLSGPTRRPEVAVQGKLEDLRVDTVSARAFEVDATVPDVTHPLDADGTVTATRLSLGDQLVEELRAVVATRGRELDLGLSTKGLGDVGVLLRGTLDADNEGLRIASLQLDTGTDRWVLDRPTHVGWGDTLRLEPAALSSGAQRVRVEGTLRGQQVKGALATTDLDLGRLPRLVVPADLGVAGLVTLEGTVEGALQRPDVVAKVSVRGGAVKGVTGLEGTVDGRFIAGRATGTAEVGSSLGAVDARFDVPVFGVRDATSEGLDLQLDVKDVSLEALQSWRAETWPATGTLAAHLGVKGPANDPAVTVTVRADALTLTRGGELKRNLTLAPVVLSVASKDSGALTATLAASTLGARVTSTLDTPLTVPGLRRQLPNAAALKAMVVTLALDVEGVALETLKTLGVSGVDDVSGRASLKARLKGSLEDPTGQVTLQYQQVNAPPLEALSGELELTASDTLTRLVGKGTMQGKPLFDLLALIDTPVKRLELLDALGPEHVTAHLSVAPMPLARLMPKRDDEVVATGSVSLELDLKGTLLEPKLTIDGTAQNLSFGKVPLGQARLVSRTLGNAQTLGLTLKAAGNSELRATGTIGVDLSIDTVRKGLSWAAIPLELGVTAKDFDLGFLSGVTPMVRTVGGQLTLSQFKVTGLAGNPDVRGEVGWKKGRLALASYGDYRDITLDTTVTRERIDVQTFSVRSGGGGFALDPSSAQRQATGAWKLTSSGTATRFPVVMGDQLLAIVGVKYALDGDLTDTLLNLSHLDLARVDVELPEVKRKDIQDLERPSDLVLVRGGRVVAGRRQADGVPTTATTEPSRTYRAVINAPRNIWVRSSDLNLELGLSEGFRLEYAGATQLFGEAQVLGGRIDVIGREFKVNRSNAGGNRSDSTVRFAGPAKQPYVNVTALHVNEREKVKVTVSAVGRGTDVVLKVTSEPPMSESDIYTLLATGRRDLRRSSGASVTAEQAVSVVGSLAANQLKSAVLKRLPIDLVDVVSIDTGSEGLASTRVEVGKYLSDSLFLGYTFQPGANQSRGENTHAGRLEYQISRDVCLEATAGTAPAFGADVVWSRDF